MSNKCGLMPFEFEYCSDKRRIFENYCRYFFTRTQSMFVYKGLPDSIPASWLEQYLQRNGSCIVAKVDGTLYALLGNAGGEYDAYYQPTKYIVANPWLKLSKEFTIKEDCVYCRNDYDAIGLTPLIARYCGLMTENLLTVRVSDINLRTINLLSAVDDDTVKSAELYLKKLEDGKLSVISEDGFFDGLKVQGNNAGRSDYVIQFIELQQYLKGSLYNELGINANFNMKREAINGNEADLNDDALTPLIDDMLKHRRIMCEEINNMFGTDISVDFGSSWHSNTYEKKLIANSELNGDNADSEQVAGDELTLDKDNIGDDSIVSDISVSRLNEEFNDESLQLQEQTEELKQEDNTEDQPSNDDTEEQSAEVQTFESGAVTIEVGATVTVNTDEDKEVEDEQTE